MNSLRIAAISAILLVMMIACDSLRLREKGWLEVQVRWEDPGAPAKVDTIRVSATPGNWVLEQALSEREAVSPELDSGTYTVLVEALDADHVVLYSGTIPGVAIRAGEVAQIEVTLRSHRPVLEPLPSPDDDGIYTLFWSASERAASYVLEAASDSTFAGLQVVYVGADRSWEATGQRSGWYYYRVKGTNATGDGLYSPWIRVRVQLPDLEDPTVSLLSPEAGSTLFGTVEVRADASDDVGVVRVAFFLNGEQKSEDTEAPFRWTWDTRGVQDDSYTLHARAWDGAGKTGTSEIISVIVENGGGGGPTEEDTEKPSVTLTAPEHGAEVSGIVTVIAEAADNVGVVKVDFYVDGVVRGTARSAPFEWDWVTSGESPAPHTLTAKAWDAAGNSQVSLAVTVSLPDAENPTIRWLSPADGTFARDSLTVACEAFDNGVIAQVVFYVDGDELRTLTQTPYMFRLEPQDLGAGSHQLWAQAEDASGNTAQTEPISLTVPDITPPSVRIVYPGQNAVVNPNVTIRVEAEDNVAVTEVRFYVNGTHQKSVTAAPFEWSWNNLGQKVGTYTLTAQAFDAAENQTTSAGVTVHVPDRDAPTVQLTAPAQGATLRDSVEVSVSAQDNVGVTEVTFFIDGVKRDTDTTAPFAYLWDTTIEADGTHTLYVQAKDAAGFSATSPEITVTVKNRDTDAPTVQITAPTDGSTVNHTITVTAAASDDRGVDRVVLYVDGVELGTDRTAPYTWTWNTETVPDGSHTLTASAYDAAGNRGQAAAVRVTVANADAQKPTVQITSPSDGARLRDQVPVQVTASDNEGVERVEFYLDGALQHTDTRTPYTWDWDASAADGSHTLTAKVYDTSGNVGAHSITVTVDNSAPEYGEMVWIPGGTFQMGDPFNEGGGDERPVHTVTVDGFYMGKYEVTNAEYCVFLNEQGNQTEGGVTWLDINDSDCRIVKSGSQFVPKSGYEDHPVIEVTWYGARAYAQWTGGRLPTEAEWEYAARGGLEGKRYPWGDSISHDNANYSGTGGRDEWSGTSPMGSFDPNGYGLYDMAGNVWEWCSDWYDSGYYSESPENNPTGAKTGSYRVLRGGSWVSSPVALRCANRSRVTPDDRNCNGGFRCARTP